jgi:hypothetical protein
MGVGDHIQKAGAMTDPLRTCNRCNKTYPATANFFPRYGNYLRKICKSCVSEYFRQHYARKVLARFCADCGEPIRSAAKLCPACREWRDSEHHRAQPLGIAICQEGR